MLQAWRNTLCSSLNKQAAHSLHNLSSHALFSGTKVLQQYTTNPQAGPGSGSPFPSTAQILMSSPSGSLGRYRTETERKTDQGDKKNMY